MIIEGKVVRLWISHGKGAHYHVAYQYSATAGARVLQGEVEIPEREFQRLEVDGPLGVKVCRADPANHLVHGATQRTSSDPAELAIALGLLGMLGLAGVFNLWWWWACRRSRASWGFSSTFVVAGPISDRRPGVDSENGSQDHIAEGPG
jgi:hypothetical protein